MHELPSEQAQDLAQYLINNQDRFIIEGFTGSYVDDRALSQTIQDYWDSLL